MKDCVVQISKSGKNLFARIPDDCRDVLSRGDKVKIILLEKATSSMDEKQLRKEIKQFLENPNGEKLKGTLLGISVEIPVREIIMAIPKKKAENLLFKIMSGRG